MESKKKTKFHKYYAFQKLTIISVTTKIMIALTNFVSNLLKTFGEQLSTKINHAISQNQCKISKKTDFG